MQRSLRSSERVEPEEFSSRVSSVLGDAASETEVRFGQVWTRVHPERLADVLSTLKTDPDLSCDYLTFLSAIDWQEEGFEIVVMVHSSVFGVSVGIKCPLPAENPHVPTVTEVYGGAHWHERECYEMFGIVFDGHPNLRNLYLPDDFEGHPLLKSFKLASRVYKPWPGAKDPDEAAGGGRG
ncbi:MAG: NADH-quinone oxidoreductase subunit C [Actinomycetota bacterium]|nr:NADH-quinone oxidoreductase subunit C [Actinomycetota bacterium]